LFPFLLFSPPLLESIVTIPSTPRHTEYRNPDLSESSGGCSSDRLASGQEPRRRATLHHLGPDLAAPAAD
jgi:hypothetical protein